MKVQNIRTPVKNIIDREALMQLKRCAACGNPFNLGETVVLACGGWEGPPKWIHENEALFDEKIGSYIERKCLKARQIND